MTGDQIFLSQLKVDGKFGVSDSERHRERTVLVDVVLTLDLSRAGVSDDLADTIGYSQVARVILELAETREYHLLEKFCADCADTILATFPATHVKIRARKERPSGAVYLAWAGVEIERSK